MFLRVDTAARNRERSPVMLTMPPVIFESQWKAVFYPDPRLPPRSGIEFCCRAIDAADIDSFLFRWERNNAIRAAARGFEKTLYKVFELQNPNSGKIEIVAFQIVVGPGNQECIDDVIDVIETADLLPIAEYLNFLALDGL